MNFNENDSKNISKGLVIIIENVIILENISNCENEFDLYRLFYQRRSDCTNKDCILSVSQSPIY